MSGTTSDPFYQGRLTLHQPEKGYRFSIDAVLLAAHAHPRPGDLVVDVGTGCGVVALLMAQLCVGLDIRAVELQAELAQLARRNVIDNHLEASVHIIEADIKDLGCEYFPRPADLIVTNPPYYRLASGRLNPDDQRAVARHELRLTLNQLLGSVKRILRTGGRLVSIYTTERLVDLMVGMRHAGLEPKNLRMVHSTANDEAKLCIVEGIQQGRPGLKMQPPLVIYASDGEYTDEVCGYLHP